MPYTNDPANNPVDAVRLKVGDIYEDFEILDDVTYQYFLSENDDNVVRASLDAARAILFKLTRWSRERTGDIEVYGNDWFKNYRNALTDMLRNPNLSIFTAMPYAGGISKQDMADNDSNPDNVLTESYIGMTDETPVYSPYGGSGSYF